VDLLGGLGGGAVVIVVWVLKELYAPDFLDRRKQERANRQALEAERRAFEREDAPVRARIISAARDLLQALRRVFIRGQFSLAEWQSWHDKLYNLVESNSGARALGSGLYLDMVEALNYDQLSINVQVSVESSAPPAASSEAATDYRRRQHDAQLTQNVGTACLKFVPILVALGVDDADKTFGTMAWRAIELAERELQEPPM